MTSVSDVTGTELLPNGQNLDAAIAEGKRAHQLDRAHVFHSWSAQAKLAPMTVIAAQGSYLDGDGNRLLDFSSQMVNTNIGHQHPKVVAAIAEQAAKLCTIAPAHVNSARSEAARLIAELTPGTSTACSSPMPAPTPSSTPSGWRACTPAAARCSHGTAPTTGAPTWRST
jgi:taurine--2-oxoglutarate transaminase